MKKINPSEAWELSKSVAKFFLELGYSEIELLEMDKFELSKKFGDVRIAEMPDKVLQFDGKDIDEEDTFGYFQTLVKFHFATFKNGATK